MSSAIFFERVRETPVEKQKIEIVERKGLGHPDYIADSIAEEFSRNLSKYYIEHFGSVLHHNVDKLEVIGGETVTAFGGGKVVKPITVMFSGRATSNHGEKQIPVREIAVTSAKEWIKTNLRFLDPESIRFLFETNKGSDNLTDAFSRKNGGVSSNDTSFGVGYYPLSETEELVLKTERILNSKEFKSRFPFTGEDVKVMAVRKRNDIDITVAMAFVDRYIGSVSDYFDKKESVLQEASKTIKEGDSGRKVSIKINTMDVKGRGKNGAYLTVTGLSAEGGDDGAVGRGNRVNGLITPNRVMTLEAAAGKNPVNHIGKIYSLFSSELSRKIFERFKIENRIRMVGRIGNGLDKPIALSLQTSTKVNGDDRKMVLKFMNEELSKISGITEDVLAGKLKVC